MHIKVYIVIHQHTYIYGNIHTVNYGQAASTMNAMAGYVSLAGIQKDSLFAVKEGIVYCLDGTYLRIHVCISVRQCIYLLFHVCVLIMLHLSVHY